MARLRLVSFQGVHRMSIHHSFPSQVRFNGVFKCEGKPSTQERSRLLAYVSNPPDNWQKAETGNIVPRSISMDSGKQTLVFTGPDADSENAILLNWLTNLANKANQLHSKGNFKEAITVEAQLKRDFNAIYKHADEMPEGVMDKNKKDGNFLQSKKGNNWGKNFFSPLNYLSGNSGYQRLS